eukprot:scaffold25203_cov36-Cyclotella_meneghiniana.AAC.3
MEMDSPTFRVYSDADTENTKSKRIHAVSSLEHVAPSKHPPLLFHNNNPPPKKRWDMDNLSKYLASHKNSNNQNKSSSSLSEEDSQCTGATSKMTDTTAASAAMALPQQIIAKAARSNILSIGKSKIGGVANKDDTKSTSRDNYYHPTKDDQVEAWMIHPKHPVETIIKKEQQAVAVIESNVPSKKVPAVDNGTRPSKKKVKSQQQQQQHRQTSTASASKTLRELEETINTLRNQLSNERRGFAIMASKFKAEKDNMSSHIQDLSWKVTLRGEKVNRLEKMLSIQNAEREKKQSSATTRAALLEQETRREQRPKGIQNRNEKNNVNTISELLKYELDRIKADHEEVTSNYDELTVAYESKRIQFESALNTLQDAIGGLNEFNMLKPMAYGCLMECLDELTEVKDHWDDIAVVQNHQEGGNNNDDIEKMIPARRNSAMKFLKGAVMSSKQQDHAISPGSGSDSSTAEMTMETCDTMFTGS